MKRIFIIFILILLSGHYLFSQHKINSKWAKVPYSNSRHWIFNANDSITGSWNYIAPMPNALWGVTSYYLSDYNKIFLCGGADDNGSTYRTCFMYDIATNTYVSKDSLPEGRFSGKLVKVGDSLYLVGSANTSFFPDGALYRYDIHNDLWQVKASTPSPLLQEMAVCVWNDTVIITIGGSTNGFDATNSVRLYDPILNEWSILLSESNLYPDNITSAHAECIGSNIVVVGGFGMLSNETVYRGYIPENIYIDSLYWLPDTTAHPFSNLIYRVAGGQWGSYMIFGPAMYNDSVAHCLPQIWGFNIVDSTWTRFLPNPNDTVSDIPTIAVKPSGDSIYFYIFGGAEVIHY